MPIIRPRPRTSRTRRRRCAAIGPQPLDEQSADAAGVALEVVFQQIGEVGEAGRHGDRGAAEGGDGVGVQAVHDLGAGDDTADGHAVADALGEGERCPAGRSRPCACQPQKCSPVRPQPVCTSSVIHRMPCRSRTSRKAAYSPSGGEVKPPTPWMGSAISAAGGAGVAEQVLQVGDAGLDELGVAQLGVRAAGADAAVHVQRLQRGEAGRRPAAGCR